VNPTSRESSRILANRGAAGTNRTETNMAKLATLKPRLATLGERHGPRAPWTKATAQKRITGRRLQKLRKELFEEQPLCVLCLEKGLIRAATIRDHQLALALGGTDTEDNVQALCRACNEAKRIGEATAGKMGTKI
jgi:hypothetical protein